jgi:hypothetical protein
MGRGKVSPAPNKDKKRLEKELLTVVLLGHCTRFVNAKPIIRWELLIEPTVRVDHEIIMNVGHDVG